MAKEINSTNLLEEFPFLEIMHPAHLKYIQEPPTLNSLDYLFDLIDDMDNEKRDIIFNMTYVGLKIYSDENNYDKFKTKVYSLSNPIFDQFLINSIVNFTLNHIFGLADKTKMDKLIKEQEIRIKWAEELKSDKLKMENHDATEIGLDTYVKHMQKVVDEFPERSKEFYDLYTYFCNTVVSKLYNEPIKEVLDKSRFKFDP